MINLQFGVGIDPRMSVANPLLDSSEGAAFITEVLRRFPNKLLKTMTM